MAALLLLVTTALPAQPCDPAARLLQARGELAALLAVPNLDPSERTRLATAGLRVDAALQKLGATCAGLAAAECTAALATLGGLASAASIAGEIEGVADCLAIGAPSLFVLCQESRCIVRVNCISFAHEGTVQLPVGGDRPVHFAVNADGGQAWVRHPEEPSQLLVFNTRTGALDRQVNLPGRAGCLAMSAGGEVMIVALAGAPAYVVIDPESGTLRRRPGSNQLEHPGIDRVTGAVTGPALGTVLLSSFLSGEVLLAGPGAAGQPVIPPECHGLIDLACDPTSSSRFVATASRCVLRWDPLAGCATAGPALMGQVTAVACAPGERVFAGIDLPATGIVELAAANFSDPGQPPTATLPLATRRVTDLQATHELLYVTCATSDELVAYDITAPGFREVRTLQRPDLTGPVLLLLRPEHP